MTTEQESWSNRGRLVHSGEEITADYSTVVSTNTNAAWLINGNLTWTMECNCGSENCRRVIGNVMTIPEETLKIYYQIGALPDFIKGQVRKILYISVQP